MRSFDFSIRRMQWIFLLPLILNGAFALAVDARSTARNKQDTLLQLMRESEQLRNLAAEDVIFLIQNIANCTSYHESVITKVLNPAKERLQNILDKPTLTLANMQLPQITAACRQPISAEYLNLIQASATAILQQVSYFQSELQTTRRIYTATNTGDGFLIKAFAADPNYPKCVALDPQDPNSSKEARRYTLLKAHVLRLGQIAAEITRLSNEIADANQGNACNRNGTMVAAGILEGRRQTVPIRPEAGTQFRAE